MNFILWQESQRHGLICKQNRPVLLQLFCAQLIIKIEVFTDQAQIPLDSIAGSGGIMDGRTV